jgi:hypothetical protein
MTRLWLAQLLSTAFLSAQTPPPETPVLEYTGPPLTVPYPCDDADLEWAGLACGDAPCPIYVEMSFAAAQAKTILIAGNFHGSAVTLGSLLLRSEDGGRTWREAFARIRGAELDHIQMLDAQNAWVSGEVVQPVALDPFFLISGDGGKSWDRVALFEEGTPGAILQFSFDSKEHGLAVVDRGGGEGRYALYESRSGGRSWTLEDTSDEPLRLKAPPDPEWRVRAEPKLYRLEHLEDTRWSPFASFAIPSAKCRTAAPAEPQEPKEIPDDPPPAPADPAAPPVKKPKP